MKLVVGLGNPGGEYEGTRHNVGWLFLDWLIAENTGVNFSHSKKLLSEVTEIHLENEKILLLKPQTFMNESGRSVSAAIQFYKLSPSDVVVIHDDLDIAFGQFKIQNAKGPKAHNGITSVESAIGSIDFLRVRIGIDRRNTEISGKDYVLQNFTGEEKSTLGEVFPQIFESLKAFLFTS